MKRYRGSLPSLQIDYYAQTDLAVVSPDEGLATIEGLMSTENIRHVVVVDSEQKLLGLISQRELRLFLQHAWAEKFCASDVMIQEPYCVEQGTPLLEVLSAMKKNKYGAVVVLNEDRQAWGIFTTIDALHLLQTVLVNEVHL